METHSKKLKENKIAVKVETVNGRIGNKGETFAIIPKAITVDAKVGNRMGDAKERIVGVVVDKSCEKDEEWKEERITERKKVLDKRPIKARAFVYKGDPQDFMTFSHEFIEQLKKEEDRQQLEAEELEAENLRADQNDKVEAIVMETSTAGGITRAKVGDITPIKDGEQPIKMVDSRLIGIQGKNSQRKDMGMNTPMEMHANLGSTEKGKHLLMQ